MTQLLWIRFFSQKNMNITLMYLLVSLIIRNWKKSLEQIQSFKDESCHLWDQNGPLTQTRFFSEKVTTYSWPNYCPPSLYTLWRKFLGQFYSGLHLIRLAGSPKKMKPTIKYKNDRNLETNTVKIELTKLDFSR